ncbi:HAMP domain-containing methyl-accepting chemotaxis protein [Cytobacillus firmus]|uniref:Methyl-accepting chemotaxis protein n=1 Tax=Cytobacillus firmus TaxID=1399 RepID=A0A800NEG3_CYTFI|nr:HAMP domain-containing methyl-accepting chemotaxis protein [Cytobacillus firmus]KAF0825318.1 Methyl-accepting chemotaxis protein [Cytobacillus firmus]
MGEKKGYKFGLRKKLVLFITSLAIITYTTSAVFLYFLFPSIEEVLPFGEAVFTILTLGMGIFWSGVLAFFAAGFIIKPLQKLEKTALMAANGDIGQDAELSKSDDEIRSLGIAFNHMLFNLRDMVQKIDENFKETNEKVIAMSSESSAAAEQADSIARTISEISQGADSSAVSIQSTAESMEDVLRIAQEVQDTAKASQNVSGEMVQDLMESKKVIHSLISGIEKLAQDNEESLQTVKRLEQNAVKVEQIIQLVGDIAAQTNLLALNASIEAARAGDHGKGFAVVAEEVRKLADESAQAVQGISELIKNIQEEVRNVVAQISYQVETANNEVKKGTKTNEVIEEMAKVVNEMAASVSAISGLVDNQMEGIQHTSTQSQEVAAIAEETSAGAQEVSAATQHQTAVIGNVEKLAIELKEQAEKLNSTITKFKL